MHRGHVFELYRVFGEHCWQSSVQGLSPFLIDKTEFSSAIDLYFLQTNFSRTLLLLKDPKNLQLTHFWHIGRIDVFWYKLDIFVF